MTSVAKIAGSAFIGFLGSFPCWIGCKAMQLESAQRGSILQRIGETVEAFTESIKMADKAIARKHISLVSSLSSRQYAASSQSKMEQTKLSYCAKNPYQSMLHFDGQQPFVFRFARNLPMQKDGNPYEDFIFSGPSSRIYDVEARDQIIKGQYIRCIANLPHNSYKEYVRTGKTHLEIDVIISSTTNRVKCVSFQTALKNDFVMVNNSP